ncbi:Homeodomain-like protein, partial [Pavlovales sp. CCMP2436]
MHTEDTDGAAELLKSAGSRVVKHRWTPKEDQMLMDAIAVRGPHNWLNIAGQLPDRNEKQCRERWVNQLRPDMRKGNWTIQEDAKIIEIFNEYGS